MGKNRRLAHSISFGLHLLLICFLIWQPSKKEVKEEEPLLVTFNEPKPIKKSAPAQKKKPKGRKGSKGKKGNGKGQKDYGFYAKFSPLGDLAGDFSDHKERSNNEWSGNAVMETMNGMGLSEYSENYHFFEVLAGHLNQNIPYPKELWEHQIEGKVWFKVLVNRKGQLIQVIDSSKKHPVLSAYVMVNIYRALKHQFPRRYWYSKDKELAFYLHFNYQTSPSSIHNIPAQQSVRYFKNRIEFKRVAKVPDWISRKLAENARYIPPIVPTPLGPIVDFVRVYHLINAWMEEDPKTKKKNKFLMTKEKMDALLNQEQKNFK